MYRDDPSDCAYGLTVVAAHDEQLVWKNSLIGANFGVDSSSDFYQEY